ncbi:MAG: trimethylamine methyltransferase family protein, partial [Eubacterium sp.]
MRSYEKYISKESIEKVHEQSLHILKNIGVQVEHDKACALLKKNGAVVDGYLVKIDEKMVEDALKLARPTFDLHSTKLEVPIKVGGGSSLVGPASSNIYINEDGHIRKMTDDDVIRQFKLSDTSPVTDFNSINFAVEHQHLSEEQLKFGSMVTALKYSNKLTMTARPDMFGVAPEKVYQEYSKGLEIFRQFEGVEESDKIVHVGLMNTLTPLALHGGQIDMAYAICEAGQAVWLAPCGMPLMTAPASVAGMVAMTNAEILMGYVLCKLINPEAAFIYGNTSASTDMRTVQLAIGAPETALVCYATAGLADLYHLPFRTGGGLSDAKDCDVQAGMESMMMIEASIDCGADFIHHGCGTIGAFNVVSFEKFLMDEEAYEMIRRMQRGVDCNDKLFLMKDIEKTGPRGTFLSGRTP